MPWEEGIGCQKGTERKCASNPEPAMHVVKPTLKDAQSIRKMKRGKENSLVYNMDGLVH